MKSKENQQNGYFRKGIFLARPFEIERRETHGGGGTICGHMINLGGFVEEFGLMLRPLPPVINPVAGKRENSFLKS